MDIYFRIFLPSKTFIVIYVPLKTPERDLNLVKKFSPENWNFYDMKFFAAKYLPNLSACGKRLLGLIYMSDFSGR